MSVELLLLFAGIMLVVAAAAGRRYPRFWLGATVGGSLAALGAGIGVLSGAMPECILRGAVRLGGEFPSLRLDGMSALFLALVSLVAGAGAIYSRDYWSDREQPRSAGRGRMWWSVMTLSMSVVLLAGNGLHFLVAWELFTVAAYFLITLDNRNRKVRAAGWLFLGASHAGTLCLFAFFSLLAARTGSWELGPELRDCAALAPLFWLALVGFGVKAGQFPLHVWLPSAHANAPSHVSALMSGVALKMGVYGILRFSGWLPVPATAGWVVLALGGVGAVFGIAFAFAQTDLKRLLAYCSVENIGVILVGVGAALLARTHGAPEWGRLALVGALLHVWNHGVFKALLFFGAGSVLHATGERDMNRLGGLWRALPWTASLFGVGALAVSALPPLNGFVGEWLIYSGLFGAAARHGSFGWAVMPAAMALGVAGALALASFAKAGALTFCGAPRTKRGRNAHEAGKWMLGPMVALAGVCLAIGLVPAVFAKLVAPAATAWHGAWGGVQPLTAPLGHLGVAHVVLLVGAGVAAMLLWRRSRANGVVRGPTWDCGYAAPTARMQYTGGSFAGIVTGWFAWLLRPERKLVRPHGVLPKSARSVERIPEAVLERVLAPVARGVLLVSTAVRRLQHGRLQSYILYLVAGLVGIGLIVFAGGAR